MRDRNLLVFILLEISKYLNSDSETHDMMSRIVTMLRRLLWHLRPLTTPHITRHMSQDSENQAVSSKHGSCHISALDWSRVILPWQVPNSSIPHKTGNTKTKSFSSVIPFLVAHLSSNGFIFRGRKIPILIQLADHFSFWFVYLLTS